MPGNVYRNQVNEANHRAFYRRWLDLMQAHSWSDVPKRDSARLDENAFVHGQAAKEVA